MIKKLRFSYDVIKALLLNNRDIIGVFVHTFPNSPKIQQRISFSDLETLQFELALNLRDAVGLPFWDALMLTYKDRKHFSTKILDSALLHQSKKEKTFIDVKTFFQEEFELKLRGDINYAFNSEVVLSNGSRGHILMLDFQIPQNAVNQKIAEHLIRCLDIQDGFLFNSGRSYHYLGKRIVDELSMIRFLSTALFFTPLIDKMWIAHQLIDRSCSLRITKKDDKYPHLIKEL